MEGKRSATRGWGMVESLPSAAELGVALLRKGLSEIDVGALSDHERLGLAAELERLKGAASAAQARAVHAVRLAREETAPRDALRSVGSEVALARRESPTLGDRFVGLARALVEELPETMARLEAGEVVERHAVEITRETAVLSREDRAEVDRRLAPVMGS